MMFKIDVSIDLLCTEHDVMRLIYTHYDKYITFIKMWDFLSLKTVVIFNINGY